MEILMNKRLKELAADAGYPDYMTYGQDKVLERFAELIIQECCDQVSRRPYIDDGVTIYLHPKTIIKNHFGLTDD